MARDFLPFDNDEALKEGVLNIYADHTSGLVFFKFGAACPGRLEWYADGVWMRYDDDTRTISEIVVLSGMVQRHPLILPVAVWAKRIRPGSDAPLNVKID